MPTFETLPRFERDWKILTRQQATFRKVITEYFVPDLVAGAHRRRSVLGQCCGAICRRRAGRCVLWPRLAACGLWVAGLCGWGWVVLVGLAAGRGGP